ncbi:hypothetical protein H7I77_09805 [Mycolicibacterium novocastrense]|uniref:Uncharacterized protein n=1 Tax=Mycolicibacterium novocastrense TaxID=59813 RepID=A0AAW5SJ42_MYCNV|nr:hypothetical protein [Mycolicibacterium novocastrense]MCV7023640.1 hypothetical protein [Mycolicibacterium novocastrense]GAT07716.1 uncharacterized protein RMCN_0849 [Mycolicibacterium novocastrense]
MCRAIAEGGRRCPCTRGDRRRAYQRLRYAVGKAATAAVATTGHDTADTAGTGTALQELQQRRVATTRAVNDALALIREPSRTLTAEDRATYTSAVVDHGTVLRDIATHKIEQAFIDHGVDDASVVAEAHDVAQRLASIDADYDQIRARTDRYLTADGKSFISDEAAAEIDATRNAYIAAKRDVLQQAAKRSAEINELRTTITKNAYYQELSQERSFGGAQFTPTNHSKMTKADREMCTTSTALYPDEMVERSAALGGMLAKRSKARAHYSAAKRQTTRRTRVEVLDLRRSLQQDRLTSITSYYVDSPEAMATGTGTLTDTYARPYATVERTPENERRITELLAQFNATRKKPATMHFATHTDAAGQAQEVIYVRGAGKRATVQHAGTSAEITYNDTSSMTHELAHRMEDRNPEISIATKHFLNRRTEGLPKERYHRKELVVPDGFAHRYMGKDYPGSNYTELFSCGMEAVAHGRFGGLRGHTKVDLTAPSATSNLDQVNPPRADPEHLALVLGLLATANKRLN